MSSARILKFNIVFHHHSHRLCHHLNVHFLPRLIMDMDGCFPTAPDRQPTFSWQLFIHGNIEAMFLLAKELFLTACQSLLAAENP